jgi:hypothetical protein
MGFKAVNGTLKATGIAKDVELDDIVCPAIFNHPVTTHDAVSN